MWWWLGFAVADAASVDLQLARGRAALDREDWSAAREMAREVLSDDPDSAGATRLYLDALSRAGMVEVALGDLSARAADDADLSLISSWAASQYGLGDFVPGEHDNAALLQALMPVPLTGVQARDAYAEHPDHPELLVAVWTDDTAVKHRKKLYKQLMKTAATSEDALWLYRAREVMLAGGEAEGSAQITARLVALEGVELPPHPPMDVLARQQRADAVVAATSPPLLDGRPWEVTDVAVRVALAQSDTQPEVVDATLAEVRAHHDSAAVALAHARVRGTVAAHDEALVAAAAPALHDLARLDLENRAMDLARAYVARGRALLEAEDVDAALHDLTIGVQLTHGDTLDAKTVLAARKRAMLLDLHQGYGSPPIDGALSKGTRALASESWDDALKHGRNAVLLLARPELDSKRVQPLPWRDEMSLALAIQARALEGLGRHDEALVAASSATLVQPRGMAAELALLRARLHQFAGHLDAAFAAYAIAQGLGADVGDGLLETWQGLHPDGAFVAAARILATWHGQLPPATEADEHPLVARARATGAIVKMQAPRGAGVGRAAPKGATSNERVTVVVFWTEHNVSSLAQMHLLRRLADAVGQEGLAVDLMAVNVDPDQAIAGDAMQAHGADGIQMVWNPDLDDEWGLHILPTTFVIDGQGRVHRVFAGFTGSTTELDHTVRGMLD